jgi:hypothetical protein
MTIEQLNRATALGMPFMANVMKAGTILFGGSGIDCLVRNLSVGGANLEVESQIGIPGSFDLVIEAEHVTTIVTSFGGRRAVSALHSNSDISRDWCGHTTAGGRSAPARQLEAISNVGLSKFKHLPESFFRGPHTRADGCWKSGPAASSEPKGLRIWPFLPAPTGKWQRSRGFAIRQPAAKESRMFARRTISISGPASD